MERALQIQPVVEELYYYKAGRRIDARKEGLSAGLTGDISGLRGIVTHIIGNLDDCHLTEDERRQGVDIRCLAKNR